MQAGAVLQNASAADRRAAVVRTCETLDQALDRAWPRADQDARARALREPTGYVQAVVDTIDQLYDMNYDGAHADFRVFPRGVFAYPPSDVPWERVDHRRYLKVGGIDAMLKTLPAGVIVDCEDEAAPFRDGAGNAIVESDDDEIRSKLLCLLMHKHRAYGDEASDAKLAAIGVSPGMRLYYDPQVGDEHWRGVAVGPPAPADTFIPT